MPRDVNTSTSPLLESIAQTIDLIPGALLVVGADGALLRHNAKAASLLGIDESVENFFDLLEDADGIRHLVTQACRSNGTVPIAFRLAGGRERIGASVQPLPIEGGGPPRELLITCQQQDTAAYRLRILNDRLDEARRHQRLLSRQNAKLRRTVKTTLPKLIEQSLTDPLTGVANRRYFDRQFRREWQRARRLGGEIALIYFDIDHFKKFNDTQGHRQGDVCLRAVAQALQATATREFDRVCRIGGEEFAILLPMTTQDGAERIATRALTAVRELNIEHPASIYEIVTASLGVGCCRPTADTAPEDFLDAVDRAMYAAKARGRNRVCRIEERWMRWPLRREERLHA